MELHREPAGRLATIFYKAEPKDIVSEKSSTSSDTEKGAIKDTPPKTVGMPATRRTNQDLQHVGQTLAWQNVCWDLKLDGENKRFLDNITGSLPLSPDGNEFYLLLTTFLPRFCACRSTDRTYGSLGRGQGESCRPIFSLKFSLTLVRQRS